MCHECLLLCRCYEVMADLGLDLWMLMGKGREQGLFGKTRSINWFVILIGQYVDVSVVDIQSHMSCTAVLARATRFRLIVVGTEKMHQVEM
jgi:hypothetical protein